MALVEVTQSRRQQGRGGCTTGRTQAGADDTDSGKNVTVGECANVFQSNRKVPGKVFPLTPERDRHKINLITSYLEGGSSL